MPDYDNIPGKSEYFELMYAYSLGCLDKEDFLELNEYFQSGKDFPWQELGEYQNLAALLPAILNMETPSPELKDKVARKLYRIKNEKRPRKTTDNFMAEQESEEPVSTYQPPEKGSFSDFIEQSRETEEIKEHGGSDFIFNEIPEYEDVPSVSKSGQHEHPEEAITENVYSEINNNSEESLSAENMPHHDNEEQKQDTPASGEKKTYRLHGVNEEEPEKKSKSGIFVFLLILVLIAAAGGYYYYKIIPSNNNYKTEVKKLNKQISDISLQLSFSKEIQKIIETKDAQIINLNSSQPQGQASGKLIISFENKAGYLQVSNLSALKGDSTYQLWAISSGKLTSLGAFNPAGDIYYFPISLPEQNFKAGTTFFITNEPAKDSEKPTGQACLKSAAH